MSSGTFNLSFDMSLRIYSSICFFIILTTNLLAFQYSDLMRTYYLTCGADYFCLDVSKTKVWDIAPSTSYRHLGLCPECFCDKQCIRRGDCCPDLFFTFPETECVNRTIIKGKDDRARDQRYSEFMVTRCPQKTETELRHKCERNSDIKSRLVHFPVTGKEFSLTFYNVYCAECHNVTNYDLWNLDIQCSLFADFNFLSTIDDVIETAFDSVCTFQTYYPHDEISIAPNCYEINEDKTLFSKCNLTGKWKMFDKNIQYGCDLYPKVQFRLFKNIFCYICNPSGEHSEETEAISECNTTGQWKNYDIQLEKSCLELPKSSSTWPFKNIFCYLCNRKNDSENHFIDIKGSITEFLTQHDHFLYTYKVDVDAFDYDYLKYSLPLSLSVNEDISSEVYRPFSQSTFTTANGTSINIYNLISQAIALDGRKTGVCTARIPIMPPGLNSRCVCDPKCVFDDIYNCCADIALELQTTCIDELALSNIADSRWFKKGYLLANGCLQEKAFTVFKDRCATRSLHDAYSIIPLTHDNRGVHYNNLYCVLCNLDSSDYVNTLNRFAIILDMNAEDVEQMEQEKSIFATIREAEAQTDQYTVWNLEITCPVYLDFSHYVRLGDLLSLAWKSKCRILYNTSAKVSDVCDERMEYGCGNLTGWTYSDSSVQWACQNGRNFPAFYSIDIPDEFPNINITWKNKTSRPDNVSKYPNIFCALCSPLQNFSIEPIGSCNVTGIASTSAFRNFNDLKCLQLPFIYYFYPFKNVFCATCNGIPMMAVAPGSGPSGLAHYDRAPGITWFPLLRNLFSIYQENNVQSDEKDDTVSQCLDDQFFDFSNSVCRNITCFPGKYLQGKDCNSLLKITKNLRYSMRLIVGVRTNKRLEMGHLLPMVSSRITQFIDNLFVKENAIVSLTEINGNNSCNTVIDKHVRTFFVADLELFFQTSLVRRELEEKIVKIDWDLLNRSNILYSIEILKNASTLLVSFQSSKDFCGIAASSLPVTMNTYRYYAAKVSDVLLCRQVELSREEYNISDDKSRLTLIKLDVEVDIDHFALTPEGDVRICYEYLMNKDYFGNAEKLTHVVSDPYLEYLWIVSLICTIISLICLILGILMYCSFPVLRTIPGKLVMLFMVCLFLSLLFQALSFFMVTSYVGCTVVGIISLFTWLSVFTSMQACNFHMFKVFSSNNPSSGHSGHFFDRPTVLYMVYILCIPLIIVIANIGLTSAISQGSLLGFGGAKCFMDNTISVILAFICPVLLICLSNILFYCLTVRFIHRAQNPTGKDRNELQIFTRLVTITGISWILQIIDSFLPLTAFSFIATMVNSLQGLFIFVAFVLNARNIGLLREKLTRDEKRMASTSTSSSSTATSTFRTTSFQKIKSTKV